MVLTEPWESVMSHYCNRNTQTSIPSFLQLTATSFIPRLASWVCFSSSSSDIICQQRFARKARVSGTKHLNGLLPSPFPLSWLQVHSPRAILFILLFLSKLGNDRTATASYGATAAIGSLNTLTGITRPDNARLWGVDLHPALWQVPVVALISVWLQSNQDGYFWSFVKHVHWTHLLLDNSNCSFQLWTGWLNQVKLWLYSQGNGCLQTTLLFSIYKKSLKDSAESGLPWIPTARCCLQSPASNYTDSLALVEEGGRRSSGWTLEVRVPQTYLSEALESLSFPGKWSLINTTECEGFVADLMTKDLIAF